MGYVAQQLSREPHCVVYLLAPEKRVPSMVLLCPCASVFGGEVVHTPSCPSGRALYSPTLERSSSVKTSSVMNSIERSQTMVRISKRFAGWNGENTRSVPC
ncbi:hypothetical protein BDZ89DRAFT_1066702 [Hymenopellis radicata]|nr:hypothetical protein BDZ89DRAFT_1066702 [Hymenopellis radicata]